MTTHSSILAWRIPWTESLESMGSHRVGHDSSDLAPTHTLQSDLILTSVIPSAKTLFPKTVTITGSGRQDSSVSFGRGHSSTPDRDHLTQTFLSTIDKSLTAFVLDPDDDAERGVWWGCKTQNSGLRSKEEKPRDPINQPSRCNTQEGLLLVAQTGDSDLLGGRAHRTANWASFYGQKTTLSAYYIRDTK